MRLHASIDIGSNSALLLIASVTEDGRLEPRLQRIAAPRLAEGLAASGSISTAARGRLEKELTGFRQLLAKLGAPLVGVAGTQALRTAENRAKVLADIEKVLGMKCGVLTGKQEAKLTFQAVRHRYPAGKIGVLDIGGGSMEFSTDAEESSLSTGAWDLSEKLPASAKLAELRELAARAVEKAGWDAKPKILIGTGGTIVTLAMLHHVFADYDPEKLEGSELTLADAQLWAKKMSNLAPDRRGTLPGMQPGRGESIVAGLCLMEAAMRQLGRRIIVSTWGIRHALILQHLAKND